MTPKVSTSRAREKWADILNRVEFRGERVVVRRRNHDAVAVVPIEDLLLIQRIEDQMDVRDALKALKEPRGKTAAQLKAELGFD